MAIHLNQIDSRPIFYYQFVDHITLHDLIALEAAENVLFDALPNAGIVHLIIDMSGIDTISAQFFPKLQRMRLTYDPHVGQIVVVGANPYLRALAKSLGFTVHKADLQFCATREEALTQLNTNAPSSDVYHVGKAT